MSPSVQTPATFLCSLAGLKHKVPPCPEDRDAAAAQELLGDPNPLSPAQADAFALFQNNMHEYRKRVRTQAAHFPPPV